MQALRTLQELPWIVYLFPMTLIVAGFFFGGWAVYWDYRKKQLSFEERRHMIERGITPPPLPVPENPMMGFTVQRQLDHEERRLMIEKGITPPAKKPWGWEDYLRFGLIGFFLGVGLLIAYIFLIRTGDPSDAGLAGAWGAAIGMAGLGCTIYALIIKRSKPIQPN
jgi:hypothetical protein